MRKAPSKYFSVVAEVQDTTLVHLCFISAMAIFTKSRQKKGIAFKGVIPALKVEEAVKITDSETDRLAIITTIDGMMDTAINSIISELQA